MRPAITYFPLIINDNSVNGTSDISNNINSTMHTNDDSIKCKNSIKDNFSLLHINSRSINKKFDSVDTLLILARWTTSLIQ